MLPPSPGCAIQGANPDPEVWPDVFKRRTQRSAMARFARWFWPQGGWLRAITYMAYRIRRLPDPAHKISRGIAAGVFTSFTPFFGLHFLVSAGLAWIMGGNVLAALLATFFGNPLTFPLIAGMSVGIGSRMLGREHSMPLDKTFDAFSQVSVELWLNSRAVLTGAPMEWRHLGVFLDHVFMPYLIGGLIPGLIAAGIAYALSRPLIAAYQKARANRLRKMCKQYDRAVAAEAERLEKETTS